MSETTRYVEQLLLIIGELPGKGVISRPLPYPATPMAFPQVSSFQPKIAAGSRSQTS